MIKVVLENFANFPMKHLSCSLFLVKLQAFRSETFTYLKIKRDSKTRHIHTVKFEEFLRTLTLKNIFQRLLL